MSNSGAAPLGAGGQSGAAVVALLAGLPEAELAQSLRMPQFDAACRLQALCQFVENSGRLPDGCEEIWDQAGGPASGLPSLAKLFAALPSDTLQALITDRLEAAARQPDQSSRQLAAICEALCAACAHDNSKTAILAQIIDSHHDQPERIVELLRADEPLRQDVFKYYPGHKQTLGGILQQLLLNLPREYRKFEATLSLLEDPQAKCFFDDSQLDRIRAWRQLHQRLKQFAALDNERPNVFSTSGVEELNVRLNLSAQGIAEAALEAMPHEEFADDKTGRKRATLVKKLARPIIRAGGLPDTIVRSIAGHMRTGHWVRVTIVEPSTFANLASTRNIVLALAALNVIFIAFFGLRQLTADPQPNEPDPAIVQVDDQDPQTEDDLPTGADDPAGVTPTNGGGSSSTKVAQTAPVDPMATPSSSPVMTVIDVGKLRDTARSKLTPLPNDWPSLYLTPQQAEQILTPNAVLAVQELPEDLKAFEEFAKQKLTSSANAETPDDPEEQAQLIVQSFLSGQAATPARAALTDNLRSSLTEAGVFAEGIKQTLLENPDADRLNEVLFDLVAPEFTKQKERDAIRGHLAGIVVEAWKDMPDAEIAIGVVSRLPRADALPGLARTELLARATAVIDTAAAARGSRQEATYRPLYSSLDIDTLPYDAAWHDVAESQLRGDVRLKVHGLGQLTSPAGELIVRNAAPLGNVRAYVVLSLSIPETALSSAIELPVAQFRLTGGRSVQFRWPEGGLNTDEQMALSKLVKLLVIEVVSDRDDQSEFIVLHKDRPWGSTPGAGPASIDEGYESQSLVVDLWEKPALESMELTLGRGVVRLDQEIFRFDEREVPNSPTRNVSSLLAYVREIVADNTPVTQSYADKLQSAAVELNARFGSIRLVLRDSDGASRDHFSLSEEKRSLLRKLKNMQQRGARHADRAYRNYAQLCAVFGREKKPLPHDSRTAGERKQVLSALNADVLYVQQLVDQRIEQISKLTAIFRKDHSLDFELYRRVDIEGSNSPMFIKMAVVGDPDAEPTYEQPD